jgi:1-phosphatidylinositol phosphodiesterase
MLEEVSAFLDTNPRETLIMCIQQEAPLTPGFSGTVREDMQKYIDKGQWFLEPRVPKLREVRGKGILMSRFGGGSGPDGSGPWEEDVDPWNKETKMGWKPTRWPDSVIDGFTWEIGETQVRTQDW